MTPARRHILLAVLVVVLPNACNIGTHGRPCNVHYVVVPAPNGGPAPEGLDEALDAASKPTTSKAWPKISTAVAGVRTQAGYEDEGPKCGVPQPRVRIVNGKESKQGAWPWAAAVGYPDKDGKFIVYCTGNLIGPRHVLTAAHCISEKYVTHVRLGEHNVEKDDDGATPVTIKVKKQVAHENFSYLKVEDDIGIITLAEDVNFEENPDVAPICAPIAFRGAKLSGKTAYIAGWGATTKDRENPSPVLKEAKVRMIGHGDCNKALDKNLIFDFGGPITAPLRIMMALLANAGGNQVCVGTEDATGSCNGDSGGPLMMQDSDGDWNLIGITSYGGFGGCAIDGVPTVYTRVDKYFPWISKHL